MREPIRIYLHIPALMHTHNNIEEVDIPLIIRHRAVMITLSIGKLEMDGIKFEHTLVLKSDYRKQEEAHANTLPLQGFGSYLYEDYAIAMRDAVHQLCIDRNWQINNEFGHFPVLHFIVTAPKVQKRPNHRALRDRLISAAHTAY